MGSTVQVALVCALEVASMLAAGASLTPTTLRAKLAAKGPLLWSLAVNFLLVPAVAAGLVKACALPAAGGMATLLMAVSPGGGTGPVLVLKADGDVALAGVLTLQLAAVGCVLTPLLLSVLMPAAPADAPAVSGWALLKLVTLYHLCPLAAGAVLRAVRPEHADRVLALATKVALALLGLIAAGIVARHGHHLLREPPATWGVMGVVVAVSLLAPRTSGALPATSQALALTTAVRSGSLSLLLATQWPHEGISMAILEYSCVMYALAFVYVAATRSAAVA